MKKENNQKGIALIMTLWLVIILAVMAFELANLMRVESNVVSNFREDAQAYSLAEAGVITAINSLIMDESKDYDSLEDSWAKVISQELETGSFTVKIVDEQRKININEVDSTVLKEFLKLFTHEKVDELTENIIDFKDANFKKWDGSLEEKDNKNLLFDTIYELQLVKGIVSDDKNFFYELKDHITVTGKINLNIVDNNTMATLMYEAGTQTDLTTLELEQKLEEYENMANKAIDFRKAKKEGEGALPYIVSNTDTRLITALGNKHYERIKSHVTWLGKINVNTASKEVMYAYFLGVLGADSKHFADEIISAREETPFKTYRELDDRIAGFNTIKKANDYIPVREYLTIKSTHFTIESVGALKESSFTKKITAIVEREEKAGRFQIKILSWNVS
ncbi:MAG: type II secretion system protein GspK [bacterium]